MNFEKMIELTDNIIQVEKMHVSSDRESADLSKNKELNMIKELRENLEEKIKKCIPKELLSEFDNYIDSYAKEQVIYENYYFKEGVNAGLGNLNYLKKFGLHHLIA